MNNDNTYISKKDAQLKLQTYCAYRDRCHSEVRWKLISLKIFGDDLEEIIVELIKDNFLNEERYAKSYARGKFRIKHWGRMRIRRELKFRKVSEYCIKQGMAEIEDEAYFETAVKLSKTYYEKQKGIEPLRRKKTFSYMMSKGYESWIINDILQELRKQYNNG